MRMDYQISNEVKIRQYNFSDCKNILELFYNTVHIINSSDYTEIQLDAWAPKEADLLEWDKRLSNNYSVVAEKDGIIVGFGSADNAGYFDLLYIHKDYQKMGVATMIANDIEGYIYRKGIQNIITDASITARPFFEQRGYHVQKEQRVNCRGQSLINYKMQKMKCNIIHIVGASGAGTSTLGQALEREYGYKWLDTDGYFWQKTDPPFVKSLPHEERVKLLSAAVEKHPKCVISGSLCGWGDVFIPRFDLVVFIDTPTDIRIERLEKREAERFGERIRNGGDMYDNHIDFIEWAKGYDASSDGRCRKVHEEWLKNISCSILRLDGTKTVNELLEQITEGA